MEEARERTYVVAIGNRWSQNMGTAGWAGFEGRNGGWAGVVEKTVDDWAVKIRKNGWKTLFSWNHGISSWSLAHRHIGALQDKCQCLVLFTLTVT